MTHDELLALVEMEEQPNGLFSVGFADPDLVNCTGHDFRKGPLKNVMFLSKFGSHLHGTTTPTSDLDLKAVFMADLSDIVLGRDRETVTASSGGDGRNEADDLDIEFIELRKLLSDAMKGQTYAVELLHADQGSEIFSTDLYEDLRANKDKLLTSNVKPFIGYCVSQAKKYGMKGSRLKATEEALDFLKESNRNHRVEDVVDEIPKNDIVFVVDKDLAAQDEPVQLLEINGKQFDMRVKLKDVTPVLENLIGKYGNRAHRAKDGVDWKAVGHAYRVIYELEELLTTGAIQFPLKDREFLREVKLGNVEYERVQEELPELIERVDGLDTDLPKKPNRQFWDDWALSAYQKYVSF